MCFRVVFEWSSVHIAFTAGMEGRASPMVPSGAFSGPEHRFEASNSNSSGISSLGGTHSDGVEATARVQNERKVRTPWPEEKTQQLLRAYRKRKDENHRSIMREVDWQTISESVGGMTWIDCQRRMDTLTKSFRKITKHCLAQHKQFSQLTEKDFKSLKLATKMEAHWYDQMCKIKEQPRNGMGILRPDAGDQMISSSPAPGAVMVCFLSIAGFLFDHLSVWFLSVICSPSKSGLGAKHGDYAVINVG